ncbi:MAG: aminotransferase class V-fold PLP-dependent enzyme [Pyrinomonadaceae bacterium]
MSTAYLYEQELLDYATKRIGAIEGVRIIGTAREKASVLSFTLENVHPHDIGTILDQEGVAIRAGSPLRAARHEALQCSRNGPRVVRLLQY